MLTQKQIDEIRSHLNKAQNPLFFFDNDPDGLCSFILLQKFCGRGRGVAVKTFPDLSVEYFKKVNELNADYIFILDKPVVSKEFFEQAQQTNIPVVWIDHHEIETKNVPEFVNYYNPLFNKIKSNEPATYLCYKISERAEDLWIAVIGCICDNFIPEFYKKFRKDYHELAIDSEIPLDIYNNSQIGKVARILNFSLKDTVSNVVKMLKFLMKVKSPYDVLEETQENKTMHKRFEEVDKKYKKLLEKASSFDKKSKLVFFQYGGDLSISADLANALRYKFPGRLVAVAYVSGAKTNLSLRGKNIKKIVLQCIEGLEDSSGGGHDEAVGARIKTEDLEEFRQRIENIISKN